MGVTDAEQLGDWIAVGELALDGRVVASPGVLIAALHASAQGAGLICPAEQGPEARWASRGARARPARSRAFSPRSDSAGIPLGARF